MTTTTVTAAESAITTVASAVTETAAIEASVAVLSFLTSEGAGTFLLFLMILSPLVPIFCCIRAGCCGPKSLKKGDLDAMETFKELYHLRQLDFASGFFEVTTHRKYCVRKYTVATSPAENWGDAYLGWVDGFLVHAAKTIDKSLLNYQLCVWNAHGDFAVNLPCFIVAAEWRHWAMTELLHMSEPSEQSRDAIKTRLRWLLSAREIGLKKIANLMNATCWDEVNGLSLLVRLREDVQPLVTFYFERWHYFQLQQEFAAVAAGKLIDQFVHLTRAALRFLQRCICQNEIRLEDLKGKELKDGSVLDEHILEIATSSGVWDSQFPESSRQFYFTDEHMQQLADSMSRGSLFYGSDVDEATLKPTSMTKGELQTAGSIRLETFFESCAQGFFSGDAFGLEEAELMEVINHIAVLLGEVETLIDCCMLVQSLHNFSSLGGQLFLDLVMNAEHFLQVCDFLRVSVKDVGENTDLISDYIQRGWSNVRRGTYESAWSNTSPIDNVRAALRLNADMSQTAVEITKLIGMLRDKANGLANSDAELKEAGSVAVNIRHPSRVALAPSEEGITKDAKIHHDFFQFMQKKSGLKKSDRKSKVKDKNVKKISGKNSFVEAARLFEKKMTGPDMSAAEGDEPASNPPDVFGI
mmetsp:Transcript_106288/g.188995  ORF Transcript_106288/g.188995 Transcript_106288/m.188995 type:complete len:640 (-) Transcript_106288:361-2280(-)|eukprot:CAMPEP_0197664076 /NCGR_PEP_ID=MMETSP1338-20131121/58414_1 /TAXON_ID=43686 ORGANISM="Pelagodinium beii, Strain RCC1491" /NCGR_SAMPLE_ID=MMETSP1338 /ASSEMBLY_ACC=CAM_ASM_000754 /LENGTH=639 /DNA_ID=CAMNT_0043242639 /DNA_START=95 /DNA_END=2014 /DNA_ORIENTATION=+